MRCWFLVDIILTLVSGIGQYEILSNTLDDAIREASDKVARMLELELRDGELICCLAKVCFGWGSQAYIARVPLSSLRMSRNSLSGLKALSAFQERCIHLIEKRTIQELGMVLEQSHSV